MRNPYTIDRLLRKAEFLGMYTVQSEAMKSGYIYNDGEVAMVIDGEICRMTLNTFFKIAGEIPGIAADIQDLREMGVRR